MALWCPITGPGPSSRARPKAERIPGSDRDDHVEQGIRRCRVRCTDPERKAALEWAPSTGSPRLCRVVDVSVGVRWVNCANVQGSSVGPQQLA
jgi:hypothetical protein